MNKWMFLLMSTFVLGVVAQNKRYGLRSGMLKSIVTIDQVSVIECTYFEDWGNLEIIETMRLDSSLVRKCLIKDGKQLQYYPLQQVISWESNPEQQINWLELTDLDKQEFNIEDLGQHELGPYLCNLYRYHVKVEHEIAKVTKWIYKGVALKTYVEYANRAHERCVVVFQEECSVSRELFELPDSVLTYPIHNDLN